MLSYRHAYHAGNFADVLKHIVLTEILQHLIHKDKAFSYIDTHSGVGLYNLSSEPAEKLQEYRGGIGKLNESDWPELANYFSIIKQFNAANALAFYPGSPLFALSMMRSQDRAWLFELHKEDVRLLADNLKTDPRAQVWHEDGLKGLGRLLPPISRRGLVLIDPSYEIKSDYDLVCQTVIQAHKKFATGIYAIWYPVVERTRIERMEKLLVNSGIRNIQRFELASQADSQESGMTSSGMFVINPPWQLMATMKALLPKLTKALAVDDGAFYKADILVAE